MTVILSAKTLDVINDIIADIVSDYEKLDEYTITLFNNNDNVSISLSIVVKEDGLELFSGNVRSE